MAKTGDCLLKDHEYFRSKRKNIGKEKTPSWLDRFFGEGSVSNEDSLPDMPDESEDSDTPGARVVKPKVPKVPKVIKSSPTGSEDSRGNRVPGVVDSRGNRVPGVVDSRGNRVPRE